MTTDSADIACVENEVALAAWPVFGKRIHGNVLMLRFNRSRI